MDDWDDYRLILALHRAGTLRAAATALGTTHTTVARRLAAMKGRHSGDVFERVPGGYRTTELGERLAEQAQEMEKSVFAAKRYNGAATDIGGPITLSLPDVVTQYLLLDELIEFTELYPLIELTIKSSYQFADIDRMEADVVIRNAMTPPDHLVGRRLFPNYVTYYGQREYLETTKEDDLRWIAPADVSLWPDWLENSPYPNAPIAIVLDDIAARHRAILAGHGLGRGACFMADQEPSLIRLSAGDPVPQADFWILTHPDLRETHRIRTLMRYLSDSMMKKDELVAGRTSPSERVWRR